MPQSRFRFYLGSIALNFCATLGMRGGERIERIPAPDALADWIDAAGLGTAERVTDEEYAAAVALREAIFAAGCALIAHEPPWRDDIEIINAAARRAPPIVQFDADTLEARPVAGEPVRAALARIASDAIAVFASERARLGRCEGPSCGALMLSSARGATRRWCSMTTCGNRAKVAAYRARRS
jgi:predicted RNA-binding Zn ribbon-like protein